ncbi:ABC transporter ATP-binding protein [Microaceticoccus formicicus]|uniref:ABC transporter ATP-binding protein n=1 Tax=Microaceticoccus formicicus TaxID=3118105 RepID=UPI003CD00CBF|nr:dipeptide ABC transporter ATP-binding protein [Peptoniphilaceae bacterium AMB_02]
MTDTLIKVENLKKYFPIYGGFFKKHVGDVKAVDGVSFEIKRGETLGLVGESGCGKSTVGRTLIRLYEKTGGDVIIDGVNIHNLSRTELRKFRPNIQMIFQDPYSSLNPRMTVGQIVGEALKEHGIVTDPKEIRKRVIETLQECGLASYHIDRYPHEFSGGQRQRIGLARCLILNPSFIIADEPISALDVSIQAQIINLMVELQKERNFTYLFISHDLSVVEHISDRVAVMYLGDIVELAGRDDLYQTPLHPYTQALLSAAPVPDPDAELNRIILKGDIPSPANPPSGCKFHTRCPVAMEICKTVKPEFKEYDKEHFVSCHYVDKNYKEK